MAKWVVFIQRNSLKQFKWINCVTWLNKWIWETMLSEKKMQKHVRYIYVKCKYMQIRILYHLVIDTCVCGKIIHKPQGSGYISEESYGNKRGVVCFNKRVEILKLKIIPETVMANCPCFVNLSCEYIVFLVLLCIVFCKLEIIHNFKKDALG